MGITELAASSGSSGFNPTTLILILIVVVAFYLLMIRPQQRRRAAAQQQANTLGVGATVRTTAGMYATVVDVDGDDVILEVAPGVEVRYMKRAVMDVVTPGEAPVEDVAEDVDPAADEATEEYYEDAEGEDGDAEDTDETADGPVAEAGVEPAESDESAYEQATGTKKD